MDDTLRPRLVLVPPPAKSCKCGSPLTGRGKMCQSCRDRDHEYGRRYRERHKEKIKARWLQKYQEQKPRMLEQGWASRIKSRYGISRKLYALMLKDQGGVCAICKCAPKPGKRLHVDHCHSSGSVRGLLCHQCNCGLGSFRDDNQRLVNAVLYLNKQNLLETGGVAAPG